MSQVHRNPSDYSSEAQFHILSHCPHRKIVSTSTPYSSLSRSENLRNSELPRGGSWSPISSPHVPGKDTLGGVGMSWFVFSHLIPSPLSGQPLICIYPCRNPLRFLYYSRVETDTWMSSSPRLHIIKTYSPPASVDHRCPVVCLYHTVQALSQ